LEGIKDMVEVREGWAAIVMLNPGEVRVCTGDAAKVCLEAVQNLCQGRREGACGAQAVLLPGGTEAEDTAVKAFCFGDDCGMQGERCGGELTQAVKDEVDKMCYGFSCW
jgi:hypothetical protein